MQGLRPARYHVKTPLIYRPGVWSLMLGVSLELGAWGLELHFLRIELRISSNSFAS